MTRAAAEAPIIEARGLSASASSSTPDLAERAGRRGSAPSQRAEVVHAVDSVSLAIASGEVVGLVGESGCGKSTLGRMIAGLLEPSEGAVLFKGRDRANLAGAEAKAARLAVQMIFQDPYASLNPRARVESIVGEAPLVHGLVAARDSRRAYVADMLEARRPRSRHASAATRISSRAASAAASASPARSPFAASSWSATRRSPRSTCRSRRRSSTCSWTCAQAFDLTYLFISHDLGVVRHISDRVVIMYLGRIVEASPTAALFEAPTIPTRGRCWPRCRASPTSKRTFHPIKGEIPSPLDPPAGCHFHPRCPHGDAALLARAADAARDRHRPIRCLPSCLAGTVCGANSRAALNTVTSALGLGRHQPLATRRHERTACFGFEAIASKPSVVALTQQGMSVVGTKQTSTRYSRMSAFGGKADEASGVPRPWARASWPSCPPSRRTSGSASPRGPMRAGRLRWLAAAASVASPN